MHTTLFSFYVLKFYSWVQSSVYRLSFVVFYACTVYLHVHVLVCKMSIEFCAALWFLIRNSFHFRLYSNLKSHTFYDESIVSNATMKLCVYVLCCVSCHTSHVIFPCSGQTGSGKTFTMLGESKHVHKKHVHKLTAVTGMCTCAQCNILLVIVCLWDRIAKAEVGCLLYFVSC